jgi:hypothetical protein
MSGKVAGRNPAVRGYGEEGSDDGVLAMDEVGRVDICMKHAQFFANCNFFVLKGLTSLLVIDGLML